MAARFLRLRPAVLVVIALAAARIAIASGGDESPHTPLTSGPSPGDVVPSFYCRAVTGPLMNRSVCYVCRNGDRPVVMLLARDLTPGVARLFRGADRQVDENRARGLRGFGVLVSDDPASRVGQVQTFAFDHKVEMPLAIAPTAVAAAAGQNLPPDAAVTVVLYRRRQVVSTHALRADELTPGRIDEVLSAVTSFAADEVADDEPAD